MLLQNCLRVRRLGTHLGHPFSTRLVYNWGQLLPFASRRSLALLLTDGPRVEFAH